MSGHPRLIIIGTGPAGCSAAITASMAGLHPILIELRNCPKRQPGETLHPGIEPILKQLGVWEEFQDQGFHRHRGIWRETEKHPRTFAAYGSNADGPWLGFQVDRLRFRKILRRRAGDLGATIIQAAHIEPIAPSKSGGQGVRADGRMLPADFVLDATGCRSLLGEKLGLIAERQSPQQRLRFGWSNDVPHDLDGQPLFRQRFDGWDWRAPLADGRCAWTELRYGAETRGIDYSWRIHRECAGPGYFLLGDAACLMDPSAANGVLRALMSGIYAAHLIDGIAKRTINRQEAALEYKRWVGRMFDDALALWRTTLSLSEQEA